MDLDREHRAFESPNKDLRWFGRWCSPLRLDSCFDSDDTPAAWEKRQGASRCPQDASDCLATTDLVLGWCGWEQSDRK